MSRLYVNINKQYASQYTKVIVLSFSLISFQQSSSLRLRLILAPFLSDVTATNCLDASTQSHMQPLLFLKQRGRVYFSCKDRNRLRWLSNPRLRTGNLTVTEISGYLTVCSTKYMTRHPICYRYIAYHHRYQVRMCMLVTLTVT